MTEIKKATIDDVDVRRFSTSLRPKSNLSSEAVVFRIGTGVFIGPYNGCRVLARKFEFVGDRWRAGTDAASCGADWLPHAVAVSDEFELWLVTELARIDREREEKARSKMPTVKAPEGCHWDTNYLFPSGFRLYDDETGNAFTSTVMTQRAFDCMVTCLKARAEALGKRIVVLEENDDTKKLIGGVQVWTGKEL